MLLDFFKRKKTQEEDHVLEEQTNATSVLEEQKAEENDSLKQEKQVDFDLQKEVSLEYDNGDEVSVDSEKNLEQNADTLSEKVVVAQQNMDAEGDAKVSVTTRLEQETKQETVPYEASENAENKEDESFENQSKDFGLADVEKEESTQKKRGFFARLKEGLSKTRNSINESFNALFSGFSSIDEDFYEELEETLIMADLGLDMTEKIIDELKVLVKKGHIKEVEECRELVINIIKEQMLVDESAYDFENQKTVMLIIGVNGVGKTTSIGKLAAQYKQRGKRVMMCAADTFRAAAIDQLKTWANRAGVEIIAQQEGSDPAAVTYDAVKAAGSRDVDILLVDTAGRLHNKKNLMDELAKMKRIIEREYPEAHLETLIVLDGSTGQNALEQARQFSTVTQIDGIILTKLDGTAKGGIAIAIQSELNVPVKYIGVGEHIEDLQKFDPQAYVNVLFSDMDTRTDLEILIPEE